MSEEFDLLAAEYVLGTLEGDEVARAIALEASDSEFQGLLTYWRDKFAALDDTAPALSPSALLWERIEAEVKTSVHPRKMIKKGLFPKLWESLSFWRNTGLGAALAVLVLAVGLVGALNRAAPSPVYVAVLNTGDGRAAAVVNAFADGRVELIPLEQIAVPEGRIIEVWTLQTREQGPVSIGRMDQARKLTLKLQHLQRPDINHLFELTLEPAGGSPSGKPTGPILMKGLIAKSI